MKKRLLSILLCVCMALTLLPLPAAAIDLVKPVGEGTSVSPYQISSSSNLLFLADAVNRGEEAYVSASYKLMNDIDLKNVTWTPIGINPLGSASEKKPFSGTFDGGGKTIRNLTLNATSGYGQGLFGYALGASIRNLTLENCDISGKEFVGGIVGFAFQSTISDCTVSGTVSGRSSVGGIAGSISGVEGKKGSIVNCINRASVSGISSNIAGVAGQVNYVNIENCFNAGTITGNGDVGGVAGRISNNGGILRNCCNVGTVNGSKSVGGVAGSSYAGGNGADGKIQNCYSLVGAVATANSPVGTDANPENNDHYEPGDYLGALVGMNVGLNPVFDNGIFTGYEIAYYCVLTGCGTFTAVTGNITPVNDYVGEVDQKTFTNPYVPNASTTLLNALNGWARSAEGKAAGAKFWAWNSNGNPAPTQTADPANSSGSGSGSTGGSTVKVPASSDAGSADISATVSGTTANVIISDEQLNKIVSASKNTGMISLNLSGVKNADSAKLTAGTVKAMAENSGTDGLEVKLPTGTVALDKTALASVSIGKDVAVSVKSVKTSGLTDEQKKALGDKLASAIVVDVNILANGAKITDFGGGKLTISVPYTPKEGEDTSKLTVWYVKDDGTIENMGGHYDAVNKCFVFETTHLSQYALLTDPNPFTDVAGNAYYYNAVLWALDNHVTGGKTATTFAPNAVCTRAQAVTFLWRAMGSPEPTSTVNPFTDVKPDAYYYKAVLWAVEKGVTGGVSATAFNPGGVCSRAQVVAFLWRAAGKPVVNYAMNFADVPADSYYTEAARWAVSEGVTGGTSATVFSPGNSCTRAQIVTFLYRALGK